MHTCQSSAKLPWMQPDEKPEADKPLKDLLACCSDLDDCCAGEDESSATMLVGIHRSDGATQRRVREHERERERTERRGLKPHSPIIEHTKRHVTQCVTDPQIQVTTPIK